MKSPRFLFAAIAAAFGYFEYGVFEPILAFKLHGDYGMNQT